MLNSRLLQKAALALLGWGLLHIIGGLYNLFLLVAGLLLPSLGVSSHEILQSPSLSRAALGMSAVWSGCIIGLGAEAVYLSLGPFRGARWRTWLLVAFTLGPADIGATLFGIITRPPFPYPVVLPAGVVLFLSSLVLSAPSVWGRQNK